jgi:NAD(P)H dehydrogenase (quinone)
LAKVAAVYFSNTDITGSLAEACITAVQESGLDTLVHKISGNEIIDGRYKNAALLEQLSHCDAIIFGSPTYMGGPAAQFKAFADASGDIWSKQQWSGKVAAGITSGTAPNGDQAATLQYFATLAAQHGMLWVGLDLAQGFNDRSLNRLGCQLGVVAEASAGFVDKIDVATAIHLGRRVADVAKRLQGKT